MRAALDKKVQGMRSQLMSFSNEGVEVSLSIPDTSDVKETFGSMIDTVVEQHEEIGKLNTNLDATNTENKQTRRKMVEATNSRLQSLLQHNLTLQRQLLDAQKKMRNFAYNIQGFLDPEEKDESLNRNDDLSSSLKGVTISLQEIEIQEPPPSLFPTEEGADPTSNLNVQSKTETERRIKKKINKYVKVGEKIVEYQNIPNWSCPKEIAARWRWAARKIIQSLRRKFLKIGLSGARIQKNQTISGKLDLIDDELFHLSSSTDKKLQGLKSETMERIQEQSKQFNEAIDGVQTQQNAINAQQEQKLQDLSSSLVSFQTETNDAIQQLKAQQSTNIQALMDDVEVLKARLNFQENYYLKQKDEELERFQQTISSLTQTLLPVSQSLATVLNCARNETLTSLSPNSLYSQARLTEEYLSDHHNFIGSLKKVIQNHSEIQPIKDATSSIQGKFMIVEHSLSNLEAELRLVQQQSKQFPQGSANHSYFAGGALSTIPALRVRLKELQESLNWSLQGIQHHEKVLRVLSERMVVQNDKAYDEQQKQHGQVQFLKDRFEHLQKELESLEKRHSNLITTMYKVENDIVDLNRQCYVLDNYNKRKISIDLLADDLDSLRSELATLKGNNSLMMQNHYDDSIFDNQSQSSNGPDTFREDETTPHEPTADAEVEQKEEIPDDSVPIEENHRNEIQNEFINEDKNHVDLLDEEKLEDRPNDDVEEKKQRKRSHSNKKASTESKESKHSRPGTANADDNHATSNRRKSEHQRSAKGSRKNDHSASDPPQEKHGQRQQSPFPREHLESLITRICSDQLQIALKEYFSNYSNSIPNNSTGGPAATTTSNRIKESITKAIQQAEAIEVEQTPAASVPTEDVFAATTTTLSKKKRKPNSSLMGSFIDYDTRKSLPISSDPSQASQIPLNSTGGTFDPTPIIGDISSLKEEIGGLRHFLTSLNDEKLTRDEAKDVFFDLFRDQRKREIKQEGNRVQHLDDLQKSLQDLNKEFTSMKVNQDSFASQLKADVDGLMNKLLSKIANEISESQKESVLSTKGLCLGCGRLSNVRTQPSSRAASPPFLPALNNHIAPGPEIYRGGFRMLGHSNSPILHQGSQLTANSSFPLDGESAYSHLPHGLREVPLIMRNKVMTAPEAQQKELQPYLDFKKDFDSLNPTVMPLANGVTPSVHSIVESNSIVTEDLNTQKVIDNTRDHSANAELHLTMPTLQYSDQPTFDFDADSIKSPQNKGKESQFGDSASIPDGLLALNSTSTLAAPHIFVSAGVVRSVPNNSDSSGLRPIFRKGFPAKKSLKAETTFAPERFDLAPTSSSLRVGSASVAVRSSQNGGKLNGNHLLSKSVSNAR